jgi:phage gpG-like protein
MPINIAEGNIKTVIHTVQRKTNTIEDSLQKVVRTLENSSASMTFFKQKEREARIKACQKAIAPITETSAKLANSFDRLQGQNTALSGR